MPHRVNPNDRLYRRLLPPVKLRHWDENGIYPEAFVDQYPNLSLYLASRVRPADLLAELVTRRWVKDLCGTDTPTWRDMYRAGFRVAVLPASLIEQEQFSFVELPGGDNYNPSSGHTDVENGQAHAAVWAAGSDFVAESEMEIIRPLPPDAP